MIKGWQIIIPFNARWEDGCDYAQQTITLLAKQNRVIAVPLAHQRTLYQAGLHFLKHGSFFEHYGKAKVFTPITWLPLQRLWWVKTCTITLNALFLRILVWFSSRAQVRLTGRNHKTTKTLLWFFEPMHAAAFWQIFRNWQSLYDCVDFWPGFTGAISSQHNWLVQRATWVVVNSLALLRETQRVRTDVVQVPLGFAETLFQATTASDGLVKHKRNLFGITIKPGQKVFGFIGQVGNRFDFPWLLHVVRAFPEHIFLFVGSVWAWNELATTQFDRHIAQLKAEPNCYFVPPIEKQKIAAVVAQFDVGLIPYNTKEIFNKNCHPLKLYEYWWFGLPVLATAIHELQRFGDVLFSGNNAKQAVKWAQQTVKTYPIKSRRRVVALAQQNTWQEKLAAIARVIST